ncbi:ABC transporter permease [Metasolibacillus sp.]|uniref:ABC transporter permease n=1 Tax=Metasolibacillus sp. TaxID=2703680 RepID=UPI0025D09108|nr:ABC transporter permease [Metasolibacillus sp.]MCT6923905.1 ABC transporter permease [Metasolibacillus sp.]MCT6940443.1 ABC transporter permease [Metasolibacillus sp.]
MSNLMMAELFKLKKDRVFLVLVVILAAAGITYPFLVFFDEATFNAQAVAVKELYTFSALAGNNYIIRLIPCIFAGFFISSEYSIGTMKSICASGNSRVHLYLVKLLVFSLGAIIIALAFPLALLFSSSLLSGFYGMPTFIYVAKTLGLTILYAAAFASMMAVVAIIFTDSGKTIGFSIIFFILIDSILYMLSQEFTLFEWLFNHSVFKLFLDISKESYTFSMLIVPLMTFALFAVIGSIIFKQKEIK